jgi:hypothetical protein
MLYTVCNAHIEVLIKTAQSVKKKDNKDYESCALNAI